MDDSVLFYETDPRKYKIFLSQSQYKIHIIGESNHTEIMPEDIRQAIKSPDFVYESKASPTRDIYFARTSSNYPAFFVKVVAEIYEGDKTGEVVTAHLSREIQGVKEGGIKYVGIDNKL